MLLLQRYTTFFPIGNLKRWEQRIRIRLESSMHNGFVLVPCNRCFWYSWNLIYYRSFGNCQCDISISLISILSNRRLAPSVLYYTFYFQSNFQFFSLNKKFVCIDKWRSFRPYVALRLSSINFNFLFISNLRESYQLLLINSKLPGETNNPRLRTTFSPGRKQLRGFPSHKRHSAYKVSERRRKAKRREGGPMHRSSHAAANYLTVTGSVSGRCFYKR